MMDLRRLRADLLRWYRRHARPFPWRRTRDPYRILVSEIMLQQTQAPRVVGFYRAFLRQFPSVRALAAASPGAVIRAWQGLGYNNRAVRLHALAGIIRRGHKGRFPSTVDGLLALPGVGPYTARAVACFAFGRPEAVLDTNVRRILGRLFPRSTDRTDFQALADRLLPSRTAHDWNQAMMELGATICTAGVPRCLECPLSVHCPSAGRAVRRPIQRAANEPTYRGHARRIYRGRIVAALHHDPTGKGLADGDLARRLFPSPSAGDRSFVRTVLTALEKDRLITIDRPGWIARLVR